MALDQDLMALEQRFWLGGPEAYLENTDAECLVVFAEMARKSSKEEIASSAIEGRWRDLSLELKGFMHPTPGFVLITYEAKAKRRDGDPYRAYCSSGYVQRGSSWRLAFHQQTVLDAKS